MWQRNGAPINGAFVDDEGNQYPPGWLDGATDAQRIALGVTEYVPPPPAPETPEMARLRLKLERAAAVAAIQVTVGDKVFDGDEESQTRMTRAILGLQLAGVPTIEWTLADNRLAEVTIAELSQALILAGQRQAELWPINV